MKREINTEIVSGMIGLILTAVFFFALEDVLWMSLVFPKTMVYVLGIIACILVLKGAVKPSRNPVFNVGSNVRWIVTGILFFTWVLIMPVFGFFVSTVVFMTIIVGYLAQARTQLTIGKFMVWIPVVIGEVTLFYLIFTKVLYVPLPTGMFF
ncbi:tripartite tricarboxylate transporter TctB family protein [Desulfopila inferna]|uniref:tripartite tricarboxylate transporter TctB family protein n=1 Tax=Desulfopila inferna TaxID=468528 RepID=UPI0019656AE3|nr:tripartite tricarboxylate transporter TctB family protein [Desulfopila inferna]MBM9603895.1 tripartite tricarboxylate transporter TctB family protein [Desulfopila inferna]